MESNYKTLIIGINLADSGSTGNIMRNSLEYAHENGEFDYYIIVPKDLGKPNTYGYKDRELNVIQKILYHRILRQPQNNPDGFYETPYTNRIIKKIKELIEPYRNCYIHLHNIHMANIDLRILFKFLSKEEKISKVFYTLHDVWSFTGGCYYFNYNKCFNWQHDGCNNCKFNGGDFNTNKMTPNQVIRYKEKYTNLLKEKLILICVSNWLLEMVDKSILKNCKKILNYGECSLEANPSVTEDIRAKYNLNNKKIILTVSAYWNEWKGYRYIYQIAERIPCDYLIMVVGGVFDTKGYRNIIHIRSIPNEELHNFYSAANVYLSTSQDESLGLTTCEAQLCGTPVVCFGHSAIKETVANSSGIVVGEDNNVEKMVNALIYVVEQKPFKKSEIISNGIKFQKNEHAKRMARMYK